MKSSAPVGMLGQRQDSKAVAGDRTSTRGNRQGADAVTQGVGAWARRLTPPALFAEKSGTSDWTSSFFADQLLQRAARTQDSTIQRFHGVGVPAAPVHFSPFPRPKRGSARVWLATSFCILGNRISRAWLDYPRTTRMGKQQVTPAANFRRNGQP